MSQNFDLVISEMIAADDLQRLLISVIPQEKVIVTYEGEELPDPFPTIWLELERTCDPDWSCLLQCFGFPDASPWGAYPDLRMAESLSTRFGVMCLCDTHGLVPGLDPHDPYWWLARAEDCWHLADTGGTPLMGPYSDGVTTFVGDQKVRFVRPVVLGNSSNQ